MKRTAVFLILLFTALPPSAFALRQAGLEENTAKPEFVGRLGVASAGVEERRFSPVVRRGLHELANHVLAVLFTRWRWSSKSLEEIADAANVKQVISESVEGFLEMSATDKKYMARRYPHLVSDAVIGSKTGALRANRMLYETAIFLHLRKQGVPLLLQGIRRANTGLKLGQAPLVDSRFAYFASPSIRRARESLESAGLEELLNLSEADLPVLAVVLEARQTPLDLSA